MSKVKIVWRSSIDAELDSRTVDDEEVIAKALAEMMDGAVIAIGDKITIEEA